MQEIALPRIFDIMGDTFTVEQMLSKQKGLHGFGKRSAN